MKKLLILLVSLTLSLSLATAQKYGHLNFGTLISMMEESKTADQELEKLQKDLVGKGEQMAADFEESYRAFVVEAQSGDLTPLQQQEKEKALRDKQQQIAKYEKDITKQLGEKRNELLDPIVKKAEEAIAAIAKENGFVMVFDTSMFNSVLFAAESVDIMPLVIDRLGIKVDKP